MAQDMASVTKWTGEKEMTIDYATVSAICRPSALLDRDGAYPNANHTPPQTAPTPTDDGKVVKLWIANDKGGLALTADAELA